MYKQSPSRNHRSKGIKVKHILQVCLLLAVCFWLIYQLKHSHENKKEFDAKDGKLVGKLQADSEIQRFGRKDLPRLTELATDVEKDGEDEEEKEEEEEEEEEDKYEEDEPEKVDNKHEEEADEGRGGGDDEIDENDTERTDVEAEREEEPVDEDKDREENEGGSEESHADNEENKDVLKEDLSENVENEVAGKEGHTESAEGEDVRGEDHSEGDAASEDQDHEGVDTNNHEAREEQYKADDASSEVAHDIQTVIPETGNSTRGSEIWDKVNFGQGNETHSSDKDDLIQSGVQAGVDMSNNITSSNATVSEQKKYEIDSNKSQDSPLENPTLPSLPSDQPENGSNSTQVHGELSTSLVSNETQMELPSRLSQNATGEGAKLEEKHAIKSELAEVSPNKTESVDHNAGQDVNVSNTTSDPSLKTKGTDITEAAEHKSLHAGENVSKSGASGSDKSSKSHPSDKGAGGIQHNPIDKSHSSLTQDMTQARTDLGTLPKIRTKVQSSDETVAELQIR